MLQIIHGGLIGCAIVEVVAGSERFAIGFLIAAAILSHFVDFHRPLAR